MIISSLNCLNLPHAVFIILQFVAISCLMCEPKNHVSGSDDYLRGAQGDFVNHYVN